MGNRLFVGNLPFDISEENVRGFIQGEGRTVQSVKIVMDKDTGRPRGFAFVDVGNDQEAQAAISALNGKELGGRALVVNEAQERGAGAGKFGGAGGGGGFRGTPHGREERKGGGFGMRGQNAMPRGSQRGGGRGGGRGS
jgi:RNA recognition motif-containing protein